MYSILIRLLLESGYEHYEISNFSLPGYQSRHNSSYWNDTPYLGLGAAAHSYDGRRRRYNPADLDQYIGAVKAGKPAFQTEELTLCERYDERVMLSLRTASGVDAEKLQADFGEEAWRHFITVSRGFIDRGLMLVDAQGRYVLTQDGIMLSDSVIRDLMWDE